MTPETLLRTILDPGLAFMVATLGPKPPVSPEARVLMLAIAGQESAWTHRRQIKGPARSFWQFERGGGVAGVLSHTSSGAQARAVCDALAIPSDAITVHEAMAWNDHLAVAMARLLLWTDPHALPQVGHANEAWAYYLRNWRPGKPHPDKWPAVYAAAVNAVQPEAGV